MVGVSEWFDQRTTILYGSPSGAEVVILGETHLLVRGDGLIRSEVTVFDELSVLTQIERARRVEAR